MPVFASIGFLFLLNKLVISQDANTHRLAPILQTLKGE